MAWYANFDRHPLQQNFKKSTPNCNLYFKVEGNKLLISFAYVDYIIFEGIDDLCKDYVEEMHKEFEMSMIGEFSFFLGLQVTQLEDGIFISQAKYIKGMLKKFEIQNCKLVATTLVVGCKLRKYDKSIDVDQKK